MNELFEKYAIISLESVRQGMFIEAVVSVAPKPGVDGAKVLDVISQLNDNLKIRYGSASNTDDV